jgi:flagella basal body P-ring formation protein FlgA
MLAGVSLLGQRVGGVDGERVTRAIEAAMRARMGSDIRVTLADMRWQVREPMTDAVVALPEPNARTGRPIRFWLARCGDRTPRCADRLGSVVARVEVSGVHARASRDLVRGTLLGAGDVAGVDGVIGVAPLKPMTQTGDLVGAVALTDIASGAPLAPPAIRWMALVKSGDTVEIQAVVDGIVATAKGVAKQSGGMGAVVDVMIPGGGHRLRGRVTGRGQVEVVR